MPIATGLALGLVGASVAGGVASSAIGAHAAGSAARTQSDAALQAANLQHQDATAALDFQKQEWNTQQKNLAPWLSAGTSAINSLSGLMNNGGFPDWTETFQAPTSVTEQNDPGYAFRQAEGQKGIERMAAARGGLLSGGTAKALDQYNQDYASNEYGNVYNRAFNEYSTRYNQFQQNNTNKFNRLGAISGIGQTAADTLGTLGGNAAGNVGNILMSSGQQVGNSIQNAAAARASGYVGGANAWSGSLNNFGNMGLLYQLLRSSGSAAPTAAVGQG